MVVSLVRWEPAVALPISADRIAQLGGSDFRRDMLKAALQAAFAVLLHRQAGVPDVAFVVDGGHAVSFAFTPNTTFDAVLAQATGGRREIPDSAALRITFGSDKRQSAAAGQTDLEVQLTHAPDGLQCGWSSSSGMYDRAALERLAAQYARILAAAGAQSSAPVARFSLLTEHERMQVLDLGRGPRTDYDRDAPVHEHFARQAARTPDAVAVIDAQRTILYGDLDRQANRLANYLRTAGAGPGTSIGVAFERSIALPATLLAILKVGAAYVPLDMSYPAERIAFMIADANIIFVVVEHESEAGALPAALRVVALDTIATTVDGNSDSAPAHDCSAETPAYMMYTSGSTGRPKGVVVRHRGITRLVRATNYIDVVPQDTFAHVAPLAFDASTFEIWAPLLNGARLAIPRCGLLSIDDLGQFVERFGVTTMWLTASLFARMADRELPSFGGLRRMLTGGAVVSPSHALRFLAAYPHCRLANGYGPTENTTFSTWYEISSPQAIGATLPIGRPIGNSSAYVLDAYLEPVPIGATGEIWVGGDGVAIGYANLPALSAERFVPDPFSDIPGGMLYRTGDRAQLSADGCIAFLGRADDQVKINGFRIELGEIEAALASEPGVRDAAVIVSADTAGDKRLVAYVVPGRAAPLREAELRAALRTKLPAFMVPHQIRVVDSVPLHPSGKIDRVALANIAFTACDASGSSPRVTGRQDSTESAIADIWCEVLDERAAPGRDVNFFDAGGDSLRLLRMQTLLNERFGIALNVVDLFENTTIAQLERSIASLTIAKHNGAPSR
jgi:amino acid adenylation domain-containing protein